MTPLGCRLNTSRRPYFPLMRYLRDPLPLMLREVAGKVGTLNVPNAMKVDLRIGASVPWNDVVKARGPRVPRPTGTAFLPREQAVEDLTFITVARKHHFHINRLAGNPPEPTVVVIAAGPAAILPARTRPAHPLTARGMKTLPPIQLSDGPFFRRPCPAISGAKPLLSVTVCRVKDGAAVLAHQPASARRRLCRHRALMRAILISEPRPDKSHPAMCANRVLQTIPAAIHAELLMTRAVIHRSASHLFLGPPAVFATTHAYCQYRHRRTVPRPTLNTCATHWAATNQTISAGHRPQ